MKDLISSEGLGNKVTVIQPCCYCEPLFLNINLILGGNFPHFIRGFSQKPLASLRLPFTSFPSTMEGSNVS